MLLVTVVLLAALGLGWAFGGRLDRLGRLPLQGARLVVAAFVAQLAGALLGGAAYPVGLAVSVLLVGVFLTRNRGIRGTGLLALGLLGNAVVVGVNGSMPVSRAAAPSALGQPQLRKSSCSYRSASGTPYCSWREGKIPVLEGVSAEKDAGKVIVTGLYVELGLRGQRARARPEK